jgi:HNH endonuclease
MDPEIKYETNFIGYQPLFLNNDYRINVDTATIINKYKRILNPHPADNNYLMITINKMTNSIHRIVWEQVNGPIPTGKVIDHIDNNRQNNMISNLQMLTPSQNVKKSVPNRDYSFAKNNYLNKRRVRAINTSTNKSDVYDSLYACQNDISVNAGIIKMICEGTVRHLKHGISKNDNSLYRFEYTTDPVTKVFKRKNADKPVQTKEEKNLKARKRYQIRKMKKIQLDIATANIAAGNIVAV